MTSRVFVVQEPTSRPVKNGVPVSTRDLSPAEQYGELIRVLSPTANPLHNPEILLEDIRRVMDEHDFDDQDWLLLAGSTALIAMVAVEAADRTGGVLRMLHWHGKREAPDGRLGVYVPVEVDYEWDVPNDNDSVRDTIHN